MTTIVDAKEDLVNGFTCPEISEDILDYLSYTRYGTHYKDLAGETKQKYRIIRRYEYNFRLPGIRVKMFHVTDPAPSHTHLVEIYDVENPGLFLKFFQLCLDWGSYIAETALDQLTKWYPGAQTEKATAAKKK
jgi:hypothetical protein